MLSTVIDFFFPGSGRGEGEGGEVVRGATPSPEILAFRKLTNQYASIPDCSVFYYPSLFEAETHSLIKSTFNSLPSPHEDSRRRIIDPEAYAIYNKDSWLLVPTEFVVNQKGKVTRISHVEHIPRKQYPEAYRLLGEIFERLVPGIEKKMEDDGVCMKISEEGDKVFHVILKAQQFNMQPLSTYEGYWHKEGIAAENICAVGLYYYEVDNLLEGSSLLFRPSKITYYFSDEIYTPEEDDLKVSISEGSAVVFSNKKTVHKCCRIHNTSNELIQNRAYIAFFVVADHVHCRKDAQSFKINAVPLTSTRQLGCRSTKSGAIILDAIFGRGKLPLYLWEIIADYAAFGRPHEVQAQAREAISTVRTQTKERHKGHRSLGFLEGWSAMDGGIMEFRT